MEKSISFTLRRLKSHADKCATLLEPYHGERGLETHAAPHVHLIRLNPQVRVALHGGSVDKRRTVMSA